MAGCLSKRREMGRSLGCGHFWPACRHRWAFLMKLSAQYNAAARFASRASLSAGYSSAGATRNDTKRSDATRRDSTRLAQPAGRRQSSSIPSERARLAGCSSRQANRIAFDSRLGFGFKLGLELALALALGPAKLRATNEIRLP